MDIVRPYGGSMTPIYNTTTKLPIYSAITGLPVWNSVAAGSRSIHVVVTAETYDNSEAILHRFMRVYKSDDHGYVGGGQGGEYYDRDGNAVSITGRILHMRRHWMPTADPLYKPLMPAIDFACRTCWFGFWQDFRTAEFDINLNRLAGFNVNEIFVDIASLWLWGSIDDPDLTPGGQYTNPGFGAISYTVSAQTEIADQVICTKAANAHPIISYLDGVYPYHSDSVSFAVKWDNATDTLSIE